MKMNRYFKSMQEQGWYLDDFSVVLDMHLLNLNNRFDELVELEEARKPFDEHLKDDLAFIIDFIDAVKRESDF